MQDPQPGRPPRSSDALRAGAGGRASEPVDPVDRSYLLRRCADFPFPRLQDDPAMVRLRRERRVFASFRAIPPLARNGRS
jgi:hypothetical protein